MGIPLILPCLSRFPEIQLDYGAPLRAPLGSFKHGRHRVVLDLWGLRVAVPRRGADLFVAEHFLDEELVVAHGLGRQGTVGVPEGVEGETVTTRVRFLVAPTARLPIVQTLVELL